MAGPSPSPLLDSGLTPRKGLAFALLCAIWGSTWLVIRKSLVDLPPLTSLAARMTVAAAVMLLIARRLHRLETGERAPKWLSASLALFQFTISFAVVYTCERVLPSGLCAVLWAIYPLLIALGGHFFVPAERLHGAQWLGFLLGFVGMVLLFETDVRQVGANAIPTALLLLVSPVVVAVSTLLIKKHGAGVSSALLNRDALCLSTVLLWCMALVLERDAPVLWTRTALFAVCYLGLLGTVTTFCIYFWLMRTVAAWRMSLISYVTPALSLALQAAFESVPVQLTTVCGLLLILGGTAAAALGKARKSKAAAA